MPSTALDLTASRPISSSCAARSTRSASVPDLHHIGDYKTAANTFTREELHGRRTARWTSRSTATCTIRSFAASPMARKKTDDDVRALFDDGPFLPEDALRAGLVDDVAYEDQVDDKLRAASAAADSTSDDYGRVSAASLGLNRGPRIAMIYATGTITSGKSGYDPFNGAIVGSETLIEYIRAGAARQLGARHRAADRQPRRIRDGVRRDLARADDCARTSARSAARRLDVGSGGVGRLLHRDAGAVIVAQPSTLTGSIGIFGGKFVTGGVYEKLGAHIESTSIGKHAEINSPARRTARTSEEVQEQLQSFYDQFVEKVARGAPQHAGEDRRAGAGPRVDRPAGEAERPGRRARRAGSRGCGRQRAREDPGRQ